ncbi:MAG: FtsX-like permease family protein [Opitutae bacterium]|jgi:putative ABC transport system permease protein|nr:FtsX-like permease family protein [Opitutae bacterium]
MSFAYRNAWREIRNNRSFCLFYVVNLAFGLVGFLTVDSFKHSLDEKVRAESKMMLGADLAIRARRDLTPEEKDKAFAQLPQGTEKIEVTDFFSMAAGPGGRSRLVKIVAMEEGFPFYGSFKLKLEGPVKGSDKKLLHQRKLAWIYPELESQLGAGLGDEIKLGQSVFRVSDFVTKDNGLQFQSAELAPKIFVGKAFLEETNLLLVGNTAFRNHLFKLPPGSDPAKVEHDINQVIGSPEVRVYSHQKAGERAGRLLQYLSDFLSLVSLVALFLATLGSGYLFHSFLTKRTLDVAILVSLGATRKKAISTYLAQLGLLGLIAAVPSLVATFFFLPILSAAISGIASDEIEVFISPQSIFMAFIVAVFAGWIIALPSLRKLARLNPLALFQEAAQPGSQKGGGSFLFFLPGILAFWGLTVLQSDSWKLANLFFVALLLSSGLLYLLGILGLRLLKRAFRKSSLPLRLASRSLARNRSSSITGFLALGVGVLLLSLIPQFQYSLEKEIGVNEPESKLPKLFLFNIQENDVDSLVEVLESENKPLKNLTPWVRGKLLKVKGENYEKYVGKDKESANSDDERRNRFRRRGFNLSYRDRLLESEEILSGRMVASSHDPNSTRPAEISVEQKYAESLDLDLGDQLEIEVGGVPILAEVVNLRRVRWTSFQPNFFVQMQPGVLETAPKTFIGTLSDLTQKEKEEIQDLLVRKFPSISILDVERTGQTILSVVKQMTWALQVMAALSILAGLVILFCVSREKAYNQRWELNLLKVLGASFSDLRNQVRLEFGMLGLAASIAGASLSALISYVFSEIIFDRVWSFHWGLPASITLSVIVLSVLTAEWGMRKTLAEKPVVLLRRQ